MELAYRKQIVISRHDNSYCRLIIWSCIAIQFSAIGCGRPAGPARVALEGAVLFDHQPLKAGRIKFTPSDGNKGPTAVATITDGFYEFESRNGPVVGKNKVQIESIPDLGFALDDEAAYAKAVTKNGGKPALPAEAIPSDFNSRTTLVVTVSSDGDRKHDFTIDKPENPSGR